MDIVRPAKQKPTPATGASTPDGCLRFATWNIHYGIGEDGRTDMKRVSAIIGEIDADVIGLQEVGWHRRRHARMDQFAFLREHTGLEMVEGLVRDPLRSRFGNALLTRLPVLGTQWIDLKVLGHPPRAAVAVDLGGWSTTLRVVVTHLGFTPRERELQVRRLMKVVSPDGCPPVPTVILGDFNLVRKWSRASRLLSVGFPSWVYTPTFPSRAPLFALDRIYLSPHWRIGDVQVVHTKRARRASDHLPLVAEAALDTKAELVPRRDGLPAARQA